MLWLEGLFRNRNSQKNFADPNCSSDQVQVGLYCYLTVREVGQEGAEPACKEAGLSLWHPNIRSVIHPPFLFIFTQNFEQLRKKVLKLKI